MSIQSVADNNMSYIVIVCRSLITIADVFVVTLQDWMLLIDDIRVVVIDRKRSTDCFQRIPKQSVQLHVYTICS